MKKLSLLLLAAACSLSLLAAPADSTAAPKKDNVPPVVHPKVGTKVTSTDGKLTIELVQKKQNFSDAMERDHDIHSPKSINVHPNGQKYYVNSLEGGKTVCYRLSDGKKLAVIDHHFSGKDKDKWAPASGLWPFTHYTTNLNTFMGKPVESTFSHGGRYLWVPYYRRSFDINAQDPSAVAVIDTRADSIVRLFETGPLPKMIATSPDGHYVAISHWGNNTVGLIDVRGDDITAWHYEKKLIVDYELKLNYSLKESVNRDVNSGYCLRGTVFSPDGHFLFVGCMGGGGGIAVIDAHSGTYKGRIMGMMPNLRHLVIKNGWLYLSINNKGYVQRIKLQQLLDVAENMTGKTAKLEGWENCKVAAGARTLELSPDGRYIFVACNFDSKLCVVDAQSMKLIAKIDVDSYPVGLDVSADGTYVFVTSQGRVDRGGNAVNVYKVTYK